MVTVDKLLEMMVASKAWAALPPSCGGHHHATAERGRHHRHQKQAFDDFLIQGKQAEDGGQSRRHKKDSH